MLFQKRCKTFNLICSFNDVFRTLIEHVSQSLGVPMSSSRYRNFSHKQVSDVSRQVSCWISFFCCVVMFTSTCFLQFFSISSVYSSSHKHLPLHITPEYFGFSLLTLKGCFTFLVSHIITILQQLFVNAYNFLIKFLEAFSFSSQHVISTKVHSLLSSKTLCEIKN